MEDQTWCHPTAELESLERDDQPGGQGEPHREGYVIPHHEDQPEWGFPHRIKVMDKVIPGRVLISLILQSLAQDCLRHSD